METSRAQVGLALSSGVARGLAHIGALQVLQEERIPVDMIAGCSAGAIFGGIYASGADLIWAERLATSLMWQHLLEVGIPRMGFSRGDRFLQILRLVTKNKTFADLDVKFCAVAVDVQRGEEVFLTEGPVAEAVLASASIPGVFVPRRLNDRLLVDGSLITRVPSEAARRLGADVVVAVDVSMDAPFVEVKNVMDVIIRSIDIMMGQVAKHKEETPADVIIKPDLTGIDPYDLGAGPVAIEAGRVATRAAIPEIRAAMERALAASKTMVGEVKG